MEKDDETGPEEGSGTNSASLLSARLVIRILVISSFACANYVTFLIPYKREMANAIRTRMYVYVRGGSQRVHTNQLHPPSASAFFFFFFRKIRKQHPACLLLTATPFSLPAATRLEISPPRDCQHLLLSACLSIQLQKKKRRKETRFNTFLIFSRGEKTSREEFFLPLNLLILVSRDMRRFSR